MGTHNLRPRWQGHSLVNIWENHIPGPETEISLACTETQKGDQCGWSWEENRRVVEIGPEKTTYVMLCRLCMKLGEWIQLHISLEILLPQTSFRHYYQIFASSAGYRDTTFKGWTTFKVDEICWTLMTFVWVIPKSPHCFRKR